MLTVKSVTREDDDYTTCKEYDCDFTATCDGSSMWGDTEGRAVHVTGIVVYEYDSGMNTMIYVKHNSTWDIYTDKGFEAAISAALGYDIQFTEQGMQEDYYASMEL